MEKERINIRPCSYEPLNDMIPISYGENRPEEFYLEVKYRLYWFILYCQENGIPYSIDESGYEFRPETGNGLICATVKIRMGDSEFASSASVALMKDNGDESSTSAREYNSHALQTAETIAKGRALANAGFGTVAAGSTDENGELFPADSGVKLERDPANPLIFRKTVSRSVESVQPENGPDEAFDAVAVRLVNARNFIVPMGSHKGEPLYQVMATDPGTVRWWSTDAFDQAGRYPAFKEAVKTILES